MFVLEVGAQKHRIALVPREFAGWEQLYDVLARLAPDFTGQKWLSGQTLDGALQYAEKRAHLLLEKGAAMVDRNASWRNGTISEGQAKTLKWYKIPYGPGTTIVTKGQASDAIDLHKQELERKKAAKAVKRKEVGA
jgi:hypothetical protein